MMAMGKFRDDLFHRLNILSVHIPALRQRPADVQPLVKHFVQKHKHLSAGQTLPVDPDFVEALMRLEMPGNARELENLVRRALVDRKAQTALSLSDLPVEILGKLAEQPSSPGEQHHDAVSNACPADEIEDHDVSLSRLLQLHHDNLAQALDYCERSLIVAALSTSNGNQSRAARLLGITPRSIYNKLRKHHLR
jgi:DNA-binding NtrC family response regulator